MLFKIEENIKGDFFLTFFYNFEIFAFKFFKKIEIQNV